MPVITIGVVEYPRSTEHAGTRSEAVDRAVVATLLAGPTGAASGATMALKDRGRKQSPECAWRPRIPVVGEMRWGGHG